MISTDAEYAFVSSQVRWCSERITDAFNMYIRLFSAIVAGSIYLSIQPGIREHTNTNAYVVLSDIAVLLAALVGCVVIFENFRSRRGYRERVSELGGTGESGKLRIPLPKTAPAAIENGMVVAIIGSTIGFLIYNPFLLLPTTPLAGH